MTNRRSAGSKLILLAIALGVSLLAEVGVADREISSGLSAENRRQDHTVDALVEPALSKAPEILGANRVNDPTELALPSVTVTPQPQLATAETDSIRVQALGVTPSQPVPNLADGVTVQEEIDSLVTLYSAKYGVSAVTVREIVWCESTDDPSATDPSGARGNGQFIKSTWESTPMAIFGWDSAYHPAVNIEAIAWMLQQGRVSEFHAIPCYR